MWPSFEKLKKSVAAISIFVLTIGFAYAPASPALAPKPAEAVFGVSAVMEIGVALIRSTVSAIANVGTQVSTWYLKWKESVGDGIAWKLINMVIKQMIRDTTAWVNSGFQGKPVFLENFEKFMTNVVDNVVGDYIWESDTLNFICSPFQLDVKIALDIQYNGVDGLNGVDGYRDHRKARCTLSDSLGNIQGSLKGFMEESWSNWFQVTMNQTNNPYGATFVAQEGLGATSSKKTNEETKMLEFGNGFFSLKDEYGNVINPGNVIQVQLNDALNVPRQRLANADEINELFDALINQLLRGVLSGVGGGLAGLGGGSGGDGIFNDPTYGSSTGSLSQQFETDRMNELTYLANATRGKQALDGALARGRCDASLYQLLSTRSTELGAEIEKAQSNLKTIDDFDARASSASPDEAQKIFGQYMATVMPKLHTEFQLAELLESLKAPPTTNEAELEAYAATGNIPALVIVYGNSC